VLCCLSLEEASGVNDPWLLQTLGAHQHIAHFAVFKMMILSKNVNQNMLKIPYFLKKFVKIRQALEVPPPDSSWLPAARGLFTQTPSPVRSYPHLLYCYITF